MDSFIDMKTEGATGIELLNFLCFNKQLLQSFRINKTRIKGCYALTVQSPTMNIDIFSLYFSAKLEEKSEVIIQNKSLVNNL